VTTVFSLVRAAMRNSPFGDPGPLSASCAQASALRRLQLGYPDGARSFPRRFPRRRVLAQPRRLSSRAAVGRPMGIGRAELLVVVAPDRPRLRAEHLRARRTQSRPSPPPSFNSRARAPYLLPPVLATLANPNPNPTSAWRRTARSEFQSISGQFRSSALRSTSLPSSSHG
jgi:hypothetical protein